MKIDNAELFFRRIERFLPVGKLIDVGCGLGENLLVGERRGWTVRGVDRNPSSIAACNEFRLGQVRIFNWERDDPDIEGIDLFMFCDVIEHFYRPDVALAKAHDCLNPGGLVFITTPDVESIWARILGPRWWHYHIDHLWYFSRKTLTRLAENAGFEVLECGPTVKRFTWSYIVNTIAHGENHVAGRWLCRQILRFTPAQLLAVRLPKVWEGLTLIGRKR